MPKFQTVHCSQCGGEFGPRDSGYSHCADHVVEHVLDDSYCLLFVPNGSSVLSMTSNIADLDCCQSQARSLLERGATIIGMFEARDLGKLVRSAL
jgi:hypothetical protein